MLGRNLKKLLIKTADNRQEQRLGQTIVGAEELRLSVLKALSRLPEDERALMRDRLLAGLEQSGLHIGTCLLLLGIPAKKLDELLPNDLAKLVRFVQLNSPEAMKVIAAPLAELLAQECQTEKSVRSSRRAA